jgi:hypothetical protein
MVASTALMLPKATSVDAVVISRVPLVGTGSFRSLFRSMNSLFARKCSLIEYAGNSCPTLWIHSGMARVTATSMPSLALIPCSLPANKGTARGKEFAPDSPHRH